MDRTCGCHDAADCKAHCCCFKGEEKLAWAAEHDVDPSPFVDDLTLAGLSPENCCAADTPDCAHGLASCCSKKAAAPKPASHPKDRKHAADGLLTISAYRECTGLQPLWTLLDAALPPVGPVDYVFECSPTGYVVQRDAVATVVPFSPPTPPPRS
ncbi:MAG TPA: hypothetical protein VHC22_18685 [Pirellulales bacterium]|nr:hypothetical protein [Pirellulales bacterium]